MTRLDWDQVRAWRLARHHLDRRVPKGRVLEAVSDVSGIQAQVQSSAELQVWARLGRFLGAPATVSYGTF
jgi:hypothetical protein